MNIDFVEMALVLIFFGTFLRSLIKPFDKIWVRELKLAEQLNQTSRLPISFENHKFNASILHIPGLILIFSMFFSYIIAGLLILFAIPRTIIYI